MKRCWGSVREAASLRPCAEGARPAIWHGRRTGHCAAPGGSARRDRHAPSRQFGAARAAHGNLRKTDQHARRSGEYGVDGWTSRVSWRDLDRRAPGTKAQGQQFSGSTQILTRYRLKEILAQGVCARRSLCFGIQPGTCTVANAKDYNNWLKQRRRGGQKGCSPSPQHVICSNVRALTNNPRRAKVHQTLLTTHPALNGAPPDGRSNMNLTHAQEHVARRERHRYNEHVGTSAGTCESQWHRSWLPPAVRNPWSDTRPITMITRSAHRGAHFGHALRSYIRGHTRHIKVRHARQTMP